MATIDIIILAMIGVGVIMGLIKGFVKQMASIVGLIAGLLMARALVGAGSRYFDDCSTGLGFYIDLDSCTFRFCVRRLFVDKSIGCCAPGMAEPLVRQRIGSIEVYDTDRVSYSCDRIYRSEQ